MTYMLYVYNSFYNLIIGHTYIYMIGGMLAGPAGRFAVAVEEPTP